MLMASDGETGLLTRRTLLRGGAGAGAVAGLGGVGAWALYDPELPTAPEPDSGTWPLQRHGPGNTARNPNADPPASPSVRSVDVPGRPQNVVVGGSTERYVLVGGWDGVSAHRPDGAVVWEETADGPVVAVRPGTDIAYSTQNFRSFALSDGESRWRTDREGRSIVPISNGTLVPFIDGVGAFDSDGNRRYYLDPGGDQWAAGAAVADGVYLTDYASVVRLRPPRFLENLRGKPPSVAWRTRLESDVVGTPAVDDGEVYVPDESLEGYGATGGVVSFTTDGSHRWSRSLGTRNHGLAVGPDRVYVSMEINGVDGVDDRLYALRRSDGSTAWTRADGGDYEDPVVAGDTLLAAGNADDNTGVLRALTLDGEHRWTVELTDMPASAEQGDERAVTGVAPVGDRVYAVSVDGRLHVLE